MDNEFETSTDLSAETESDSGDNFNADSGNDLASDTGIDLNDENIETPETDPVIREDIKDNPEFVDENGGIIWPENEGFSGTPELVTLQTGTQIDRYGDEDGLFTAIKDTPYEARSLPFEEGSQEYNSYEVIQPIDGVLQGETAECFNQPGGGIQQKFPDLVSNYLESGHLRRI